jgi:hypothetical protein
MSNACSLIFSWNFDGEETNRKNLKVKTSSTM